MEITITVSERDVDRITFLGSQPWTKLTDQEKKEYQNLTSLCGSAVAMKILHR